MKRKIIEIDESKCNGCGACIPNCPEGALQVIDGKARLISDLFCDGLGACIGECPTGAIHVVEREAEPYDETRVMETIVKQGPNTIAAHLKHLKSHGEFKLFDTAVQYLKEHGLPVPTLAPGGCPGLAMKRFAAPPAPESLAGGASALRQWPIQLRLVNPAAEYFDGADLLVSADCVAHASGAFHRDLLNGRVLVVLCPKLDHDTDQYVQKLAEIFTRHEVKSVTVARMEVPCCGGTTVLVKQALELAGKDIPLIVKTFGIDGAEQS